jgi:hypothetical protein
MSVVMKKKGQNLYRNNGHEIMGVYSKVGTFISFLSPTIGHEVGNEIMILFIVFCGYEI